MKTAHSYEQKLIIRENIKILVKIFCLLDKFCYFCPVETK